MNVLKHIAVISILFINGLYLPVQATPYPWFESFKDSTSISLDTTTLNHFYTNSSPDSIWLNNKVISQHAYDALDFISGSAKHGLNPNKYHLSLLNNLDPSLNDDSAKQFELLLSDGLLKLIHDISVGQFQSSVADPDWFIPQARFNEVEFLQQALLSPHLKSQLNSLSPNSPAYHKLTQALARYQSYVDRGGWAAIPKMNLTRPTESHQNIPLIRERLAFDYKELVLTTKNNIRYYDHFLEQAVRQFQTKHGLKSDGIIGSETRNAMNVSATDRLHQIKVTLERHRWMPDNLGHRYLMVNLASYQLQAINNGNEELNMKVIVGRKSRPTPSFSSKMNRLVFNPYWNVPRKLAKLDLLPKQQNNFNYFYLHDIRVFSHENGKKIEHDPYTINWESVTPSNFSYMLRQDPGDKNALGKLKFMFPNQWSIYLHDTSHRELFSETKRSLSSGCIRVEDPIALANFSLAKPAAQETIMNMLESKKNRGLKLSEPLSIYAVYFTVWIDGNDVKFSPDVYQRDERIAKLL